MNNRNCESNNYYYTILFQKLYPLKKNVTNLFFYIEFDFYIYIYIYIFFPV